MNMKKSPEQIEAMKARILRERNFPKCSCGNTLGLAAVQVGEKRCVKCRDVYKIREEHLMACRECGMTGFIGAGFNAYWFGGDLDIDCTGCGSHSGPTRIQNAVADLIVQIKTLKEAACKTV